MIDFYKSDKVPGLSSPVGQDSCRWRTALVLLVAGLIVGTLLVPVFEWAGM